MLTIASLVFSGQRGFARMDETTLGNDMTDESGQAEKSATRTLEGAFGERMQAFLEALAFLTIFPVSGLKGTPSEGVAFFPSWGFAGRHLCSFMGRSVLCDEPRACHACHFGA